jgi:hypothetical protein
MRWFFSLALFNILENPSKNRFWFAYLFPFFTLFALWVDSADFQKNYFDGGILTAILAITYFGFFFRFASSTLRKLMFVMVFLSYLGELLFCEVLEMYDYRNHAIPLYVPFGHAIVYASGYVLAETSFFIKNEGTLRKLFLPSFALLFLGVGIFLNDVFSLIFGTLFFVLMRRKKWQNVYYAIALCVIFIELVGTYFKCWTWVPKTFGVIPAINPPMGAVFFYAGGDVLLAKMVHLWESKNYKIQNTA